MARLFLLLAIVLAVFWWLSSRVRARRAEAPPPRNAGRADAAESASGQEPMVPCAHCGVHLPRSEAIAYQGLHYCRRAHLPTMPGDEGTSS